MSCRSARCGGEGAWSSARTRHRDASCVHIPKQGLAHQIWPQARMYTLLNAGKGALTHRKPEEQAGLAHARVSDEEELEEVVAGWRAWEEVSVIIGSGGLVEREGESSGPARLSHRYAPPAAPTTRDSWRCRGCSVRVISSAEHLISCRFGRVSSGERLLCVSIHYYSLLKH